MRLGPRQLELLFKMASPSLVLLTPNHGAKILLSQGLLQRYRAQSNALRISPRGLRALADALEDGALDRFMREPGS